MDEWRRKGAGKVNIVEKTQGEESGHKRQEATAVKPGHLQSRYWTLQEKQERHNGQHGEEGVRVHDGGHVLRSPKYSK